MVDIPFHNLNKKNFFLKEDEGTVGVFQYLSGAAKKSTPCTDGEAEILVKK